MLSEAHEESPVVDGVERECGHKVKWQRIGMPGMQCNGLPGLGRNFKKGDYTIRCFFFFLWWSVSNTIINYGPR